MTDRELLQQALDALSIFNYRGGNDAELFQVEQTIDLIKSRLAEDDDEPSYTGLGAGGELFHLYRRSQPKARLTDEDVQKAWYKTKGKDIVLRIKPFAKAIENMIWEKAG